MTYYSQRDSRWVDTLLGFSTATIGQKGCTITAIGNYLGISPDIVNERLKAVNGFAAPSDTPTEKNLIIWAKIAEAFPGVTCERHWDFDPNQVALNLPCVVQVDGFPIGGTMHFVEYIDKDQLVDSWDGQIKPLSAYKPQSYAIIKGQWQQGNYYKGIDLTNLESVRICVDAWERLSKGELVEKAQFQTQADAASQCQTQLKTALEQVSYFQEQYNSIKQSYDELKKKYDEESRKNIDLNEANKTISGENQDNAVKAYDAEKRADQHEDALRVLSEHMELNYDPNNDKQLVESILEELRQEKHKIDQSTAPEVDYLHQIMGMFDQLGINRYLQKIGIEPIKSIDSTMVEKVRRYLIDFSTELIDAANKLQSTTPTTPQALPVTESISAAQQKKAFSLFTPLKLLAGLFYQFD